MRLLVIEPGLRLWGSERAFMETIPALTEAYERVVVLLPRESELAHAIQKHRVVVESAPIGNLHHAGFLARFRAAACILQACRRHQIDRIYLNQAGLCRIVHAVARLLALPSVIHVRLADDIERCGRLRATRRAPVALILISKDMRNRYGEHHPSGPHKKVLIAYDPFEIGASAALDVPAMREVVCVGRLAPLKCQLELIEAVALARARGVKVSVDLIGAAAEGDPYTNRILQSVQEFGLNDQVRLLGYRTDAAMLMASYRFVAVPSQYETLGRVVLEAWSAGSVPICSADSGGAAEIVRASGGGVLYDGNSPEDIASALRSAVGMAEDARRRLVENGRTWMRTNLSIISYRDHLSGVLFPAGGSNEWSVTDARHF